MGHHQGAPRHEPDNPRARNRVSRDVAADAVPVPATAARAHRRRSLDPRRAAVRPHGARCRGHGSGARRTVLGWTARRRMGVRRFAPARCLGGDLRRLLGVTCLGTRDGDEARLRDRSEPGADRARRGMHGCRRGRRIPDRRQPVEDLGCRRCRTADADGVDPQRRARAADDAVLRLVVRGSPGRRARRDRHRRDDRSDQLRRNAALLAREPRRLRVLHERNGRNPLRRHHPRHPHRRRAFAPHADRTGFEAADSPPGARPDGRLVRRRRPARSPRHRLRESSRSGSTAPSSSPTHSGSRRRSTT